MSSGRIVRSPFAGGCPLFALALAAVALCPQATPAASLFPGDFDSLHACVTGPGSSPLGPGCEVFDVDGDTDVDLQDFADYQRLFASTPLPMQESLFLDPVPGLTSLSQVAPAATAVPMGTTVSFEYSWSDPGVQVRWVGAQEIGQTAGSSQAQVQLNQPGWHTVVVEIDQGSGWSPAARSPMYVVDVPLENIVCCVEVSAAPLLVDENSSNTTRLGYVFSADSIAQLQEVAPGQFRTSARRWLTFTVETDPPGLEPLMEWSRDGTVLGLGGTLADQVIFSPGTDTFFVGPAAQPEQVQIDTYEVTITSHVSGVDLIPEGQPVTFTAVTDPPGYENDITWLSATLYGTAAPVLGSGPTFTVQFDNIVSPDFYQWVGVRADNAVFDHEPLPCLCCFASTIRLEGKRTGAGIVPFCRFAVVNNCQALGGTCVNNLDCSLQIAHEMIDKAGGPGVRIARHRTWISAVCGPGADPVGNCNPQELKVDPLVTDDACTNGGGTFAEFGMPDAPAIPADFFGPGSDPFTGQVCLKGVPLGPTPLGDFGAADTLIQRNIDPFDRCALPPSFPSGPTTVDIEIVALHLESIDPIIITENGGQNPELWDLEVTLSPTITPPAGTLTATKTHCNGGTYVVNNLPVQALLTFTNVGDPGQVLELDTGLSGWPPILFWVADPINWVHDVGPEFRVDSPHSTCFNPGISDQFPSTDCDCNTNGIRDKCDIEDNTSPDCNNNGIPDECEVAPSAGCPTGLCVIDCLADLNENCIPDECD